MSEPILVTINDVEHHIAEGDIAAFWYCLLMNWDIQGETMH